MTHNLLILGGTTEASALCRVVHERGWRATVSLAGRVENPRPQPVPTRIGGFGGVRGLVEYLRTKNITHVVDATHPFAAQMSEHAVESCRQAQVPLIALARPPWSPVQGDQWQHVVDVSAAADGLQGASRRIFLAVGRMHLDAFAPNPQHFYLLRLVDPPAIAPPFSDHHVIVSRGPFTEDDDAALLRAHRIDLVVSKNSGGQGAYAKVAAARRLSVPVLMIDRPRISQRPEVGDVQGVLDWLDHVGTDLGV